MYIIYINSKLYTYNYKEKDMDIDMFYVNLNEMHSVQFWPSGNCSDNHVQKLVSTIHHDMFPCFLLD